MTPMIGLAFAAGMPPIDVAGELLRVLLSLVGIVALIFAAGWLTRRLQARQSVGGRRLRCIESMSVGTRERVLLIDAAGKRMLLGVGAGGVRTLHVYDGDAPMADEVAAVPAALPSFAQLLGRIGRKP